MIRTYRKARKWSQEDLAERVLKNRAAFTTVSNWETARVRPDIEQGNDLIVALRMPAEEFWRAMGCLITPPNEGRVPLELLQVVPQLDLAKQDQLVEIAQGLLLVQQRSAAGAR